MQFVTALPIHLWQVRQCAHLHHFPRVGAQLQHRRPSDGRRVRDVLRAAAAEERGAVPHASPAMQHPQRVFGAPCDALREEGKEGLQGILLCLALT